MTDDEAQYWTTKRVLITLALGGPVGLLVLDGLRWTKWRVMALVGFLVFGVLFLVPAAPRVVVGWLSGDTTYRLLPARYWREELRLYHEFSRAPNWVDKAYEVFGARRPWRDSPPDPLWSAIGPKEADYRAVPLLLILANDPDQRISHHVFQKLHYFPDSLPVIAHLTQRASNSADPLQWCAVETLGGMGPSANAALGSLKTLMANGALRLDLRIQAATAVWQIDGDADFVMPLLKQAFHSGERRAQGAAQSAAWKMGPAATAVYAELRAIAESEDDNWRRCGVATLARLGDIAIMDMMRAFHDKSPQIRRIAIHALGESKLDPFIAVPLLMQGFLEPELRDVTEKALRKISPEFEWYECVYFWELREAEEEAKQTK